MGQLKKLHSFQSFPANDTELESRHEYYTLSFKLPTGDECVGYRRVIRRSYRRKYLFYLYMIPVINFPNRPMLINILSCIKNVPYSKMFLKHY